MTNNRLKLYYILPLTIIAMLFAYADTGHLYSSGKLSSSLINCIAQDRYGYIWVGTEYGLNKFDGYHFKSYLHDSKDTTTVSDNIITDFLVDHSGRLWIGSAKGLMRYDYHLDRFVRYSFPDGRRPRIYSLIESRKGDILIGTAGFGLYSVKSGTDAIIREKSFNKADSGLFYTHIYEDLRGNIWQSSHLNAFTCFFKKADKFVARSFYSQVGAPVAFIQTNKSNMLIVCMGGILLYDYRTGGVKDAGYDFGIYKNNITINSAMIDSHGNFYIGTSESGVLFSPPGKYSFRPFHRQNRDRFDLSTSYVKDLIEDKDHNIWVGCYRKGLYLINDEKEAFSSWSFSDQNYTIGSSVSSVADGQDGTTWCTVQNSGVYLFDAHGKIIGHPSSPVGTSIIYRDHKNQYWVGTGNALYQYNPNTGTSIERLHYTSDGTFCITDDGMGHMYVSVYSKGLYILDTNTGKARILNMNQTGPHGFLCNDWIRGMIIDHEGLLWMGTSNGVSCMNPKTLAFDTYGWNSILHNIQSNYLCEDKEGNIIIGTDEGLYLYDRKENRAKIFPHSEELQGKQICGIVSDDNGDLWVSTTMGIWQYNRRKKIFIGHISGNGLKAIEYTHGAIMHTADDRIAIGMSDGITSFYPSEVRSGHKEMGSVYLTNFVVDGKSIDCMADEFEIPYSDNSFSLDFSLLNYENADDICFHYRINDGDWATTGEGVNTISFTKLEPGLYNIDVRAFNNGVYSAGVRTLSVRILDPWYSSKLAYFVYILLLIIAAYALFRMYKRRKEAELEESKMRFLIDATHDIKSPLTLIVGPLRKLKERLKDDVECQNDIQTIDRNAQRLLVLVNQILDERKIDKNQLHLHCQETEMVSFIENICNLYKVNAEERNIAFRFIPNVNQLHAWIDRINFDKVVSNLLSNAFKYTFDGGEVDVFLDADDGFLRIDVADTGIGINESNPSKLFERFYQGRNTSGFHIEGTGIGLNLCQSIIHMHGGTISAENRNDGNHGSVFIVSIPLGNEHLRPEEILDDADAAIMDARPKITANKNYRILVVDDDREIGLYIRNELSQWYRFDYSPNGKDALKKLLTDDFDLVVSDVMMPEMDGITLLKKIKSNSNISDIPVILLTSKADVQERLEGLKKGADAFLAKPFNMDELHVLIDNLVDNVRRLKGKFSGAQKQKDRVENVKVKGNDDVLMERIMKSINAHLSEPEFNVEQLTKDVGISRAQLHRKMKEITGISTGEFIRNLRLEQAAQLILEGKINITQIAYTVGFNNQTHFSTVFKKHFGKTPTEYSEQGHKKE